MIVSFRFLNKISSNNYQNSLPSTTLTKTRFQFYNNKREKYLKAILQTPFEHQNQSFKNQPKSSNFSVSFLRHRRPKVKYEFLKILEQQTKI